jgi:hypothetical protein
MDLADRRQLHELGVDEGLDESAPAQAFTEPALLLLHSVAHSSKERWEDRQPSCFTCSRW